MDSQQMPPQWFLDQTRQPGLWASMIITRLLAVTAIVLRFIARRKSRTPFWWDDYIMFATLFCILIPEFCLVIVIIVYGTGRHIAWLAIFAPDKLAVYAKLAYADTLTYPLVITPVKCSIIFLYIRLFGVRPWFRTLCYSLMGVSLVWGTTTLFLFAFQCNPVQDAWTAERVGCMEFGKLFLGTNVPNVIIDFMILALPVYPVWSLQMSMAKKVVVNAILAIGAAEVCISIIRVTTLSQLTFTDLSWDDGLALIWSELECNIGVICCNLPVLGPLLPLGVRQRLFSTRSSDRKATTGDSMPMSDSVRMGYLRQKERNPAAESQQGLDGPGPHVYAGGDGIRYTTDIHVEDGRMSSEHTSPYPMRTERMEGKAYQY